MLSPFLYSSQRLEEYPIHRHPFVSVRSSTSDIYASMVILFLPLDGEHVS